MVTLVIMAVLLFVVFSALRHSQQQSVRVMSIADERQMARTAIQLIERETRMAGSGWGRDTVQAGYSGASWSFYAINPGYGGVASNDSVNIVGAWQASTYLTDSMSTSSDPIKVADVTGFASGDFIIVTNPTSSHLFQVTGIQNVPPALLHANTSPYNTGQAQWPLGGGYKANTTNVYKVTIATYRFDAASYRRPALIRTELGKTPQVVAYNVNGFHVWYELQDGTWTRNPVTLTFVNKVIPVVLTQVTDPRLPTLRDSVWAEIRPRTF